MDVHGIDIYSKKIFIQQIKQINIHWIIDFEYLNHGIINKYSKSTVFHCLESIQEILYSINRLKISYLHLLDLSYKRFDSPSHGGLPYLSLSISVIINHQQWPLEILDGWASYRLL